MSNEKFSGYRGKALEVIKNANVEIGDRISVKRENEIFEGVPEKSTVWESHNDEVKKIPDNFEILAESENCKIQAMKHNKKPFYGLQFHPEVEHTEYGEQIFKNFVKLCGR